MKIVSLFSGAGGLDRGFDLAGFEVIWANECDREVWETYEKNFPGTHLNKHSITDIPITHIPDCDGIIGGPPCQSWSEAGTLRGIDDRRGKLFFSFIDILTVKQPLFFLAENVSGMLSSRHKIAVANIKRLFIEAGYNLAVSLLNAADYGVPQDRKRVFFVGFRKDLERNFIFPSNIHPRKNLRDAIADLQDSVVPALPKNYTNPCCKIPNHEYMIGDFSSIYMSRNRVRNWDELSFTIQAGGRHAPIHPQAPKMLFVARDKYVFVPQKIDLYRRLSVRECARIQTFPDDHIFFYNKLSA
ncbi:MAG: DNA (cytosine-5-)-methyltransferase, partial [Cyanobacteria bacterium M5B4]